MWIKTENGHYLNSDQIVMIGYLNGDTVAATNCGLEPIAKGVDVAATVIGAIVSGEKYLEV